MTYFDFIEKDYYEPEDSFESTLAFAFIDRQTESISEIPPEIGTI